MALLRPGRCCSRPQGGCLKHRTGAQRRPKGEDAGGTPALPGDAVPAVRWGVSGGRLLRKPTCTLWETPDCLRAGLPPCRADHSRKNGRSFMKMNHECTPIDTKTDGPSSTTSGTRMLLQSCAIGVTMSWDESLLGARASRPHKAWHSLGCLPHLDQPGTAPCVSYGLAAAVPCDSRAACSIAGNSAAAKGTGCGRDARAPGGCLPGGAASGPPGMRARVRNYGRAREFGPIFTFHYPGDGRDVIISRCRPLVARELVGLAATSL